MSGPGVNPELSPHVPVAERLPPPGLASLPPEMSEGARTAMRFVIAVIAALVALAALGGLGAASFALATSRVVTDSQVLSTGMRSLTIDTGDVPVPVRVITDAEAKEPRVDLRTVTRSDDTPLTVVPDGVGSRITLGDSDSRFLWLVGTGLSIILPPNVARELSVTVNHRTGPLTTDADLDQLVVNSNAGTVELGGSARMIDVDVRHGDISTGARIAVTESFRATSESGNISVEFRSAPRVTEAIAGGNATVGLPSSGSYRVTAGSEFGSTTVDVAETTDPRAPEVTVHSKNGNAKVNEIR
ncbi:hypothetical protein QGN32_15595 [Mycolicibacterium sp. ND9-15]|uniref:hypothetical protein n=1 Tax=Mycolicibacterium sp. ND9-15 TaxID=3042320 RepID=UPI002DDBA92A|nr:hypothetical protein [Mycolicibacterium sp. ND9-15]WSE54906.1 hypothetical protein QGN32_15595 [Mycolicibacterium sp. ND9-15]